MKTYVIILSKVFPTTHPRKGENTRFFNPLKMSLQKLHTIRSNYPLWKARFEKIEAGKACLSVRFWEDKPYRSKQVELARLTAEDGIGLQMLSFAPFYTLTVPFVDSHRIAPDTLAANDGLSLQDWRDWFLGTADLTSPLAIIHFTKFRY